MYLQEFLFGGTASNDYAQKNGLKVLTELREVEYSTRAAAVERLGEFLGADASDEIIELVVVQTDAGYALREFDFV